MKYPYANAVGWAEARAADLELDAAERADALDMDAASLEAVTLDLNDNLEALAALCADSRLLTTEEWLLRAEERLLDADDWEDDLELRADDLDDEADDREETAATEAAECALLSEACDTLAAEIADTREMLACC